MLHPCERDDKFNYDDDDTRDDNDVHGVNALKFFMRHLFTNNGQRRPYLPVKDIRMSFVIIKKRIL